MKAQTKTKERPNWMLTIEEVADMLRVSPRHVWALNAEGRIPRPMRLGRAVRWRREELEDWVRQGCPARTDWERLQPKGQEGRKRGSVNEAKDNG